MSKKVLKASAGTGKTYRLALEYVISLIKGENFKDIIVMTFTRKATSEIKERIISFLRDLSLENEDGENLKASIKNLYSEINFNKSKVENLYKEILFNKDNLKIYTIDGFKNTIFKNSISKMLNINSFEIIEEFENDEILKKCFEKITSTGNNFKLFQRFFENKVERNIENHIATLKQIIDQRWKYILIDIVEKEKYGETYPIDCLAKVFSTIDEIRIYKKKDDVDYIEHLKKDYKPLLSLSSSAEKEKFLLDNWSVVLKDTNILNGTKLRKSKKDSYEIELFEKSDFFMKELKKSISKIIYNEKIIPYEKEMLSFLDFLYSIYDEIKFKECRFTHSDITNYTLKYLDSEKVNLIKDNKITDYMAEILDSTGSTIFIDEFQDTSIVQWKIISPFIFNAKNVICVGDEKQSIYGWRDGDKDLFINLPKIIEGEEENLDISYRSEKEIIDFTNNIFKKYSNLPFEDENLNWDFIPVNCGKKTEEGYSFIGDFTDKNNPNLYFDTLIETLKNNFNKNYSGIGILARNNKVLNDIAFRLNENKISYFLETNLSIFNHRAILPIIKLLKFYVTKNNFYLFEFLRDDLIFIDDASLNEIMSSKILIEDFNFSNIEDNKVLNKIKRLNENLKSNFINCNQIIFDIIKDFSIVEKYKNESDFKNIYKFLEISKNFKSIKELIDEIETNNDKGEYKQVSSKNYDGIALMTIHKSKGLEFDTVFYIHKETNSKTDRGVNFNIKISNDYSKIEEFLIIDSSYSKILKYLEDKFDFDSLKKIKEKEEEINNIYVALTRPKANIFILVANMTNESSFRNVIYDGYIREDSLIYNNGKLKLTPTETISDKTKEEDFNFDIDFEETCFIENDLEENEKKLKSDITKLSLETENKRLFGTMIHYFFENIKYGNSDEIEEAKKMTISKFGVSFGYEYLNNLLSEEFINKYIYSNDKIFSKNWDIVYNEYPIYSDEEQKLFRIDRLMIKKFTGSNKGEVLILDYKTGSYEDEQIANYQKLIEDSLINIGEIKNYTVERMFLEIKI